MTLYHNKYRIESTRLPGWDYAAAGCYFVTICTRDRECYFGDIVDGAVRWSPVGEIVADEWLKTAQIRTNITLDEWVVMPNHFHGIIMITDVGPVETHCNASLQTTPYDHQAGTHCNASLHHASPQNASNAFGPQRNNLSSIIRGFKGASTKRIHLAGHDFAWQPRFHDQIIRDDKTLAAIREYIRNNPWQWALDRDNPTNAKA